MIVLRAPLALLLVLTAHDATAVRKDGGRGLVSAVSDLEEGPALRVAASSRLPEAGARWPVLATGPGGELRALWTVERAGGHALRLGRREGGVWAAARTVAAGDGWFVNWADFPQLAVDSGGAATVSWLERLGESPYAYGVRVARDADSAAAPRWLHDDTSATEHGFVSLVPLDDRALFAAWLDGRATATEGPMSLRAAVVDATGAPGASFALDERVCDCCQTDAARLADGRVLVAWRDRSEDEVRDVAWSAGAPGDPASWTSPRIVREDGWRIPGCPVNGPAVCARGAAAAIAWFTLQDGERPAVFVVRSSAGTSFGLPRRVDDGRPLGRVDAAWLASGELLVGWLEQTSTGAEWRARAIDGAGRAGPALAIASVSGERSDGFLRLAVHDDGAAAAFVDGERVRVVDLELAR